MGKERWDQVLVEVQEAFQAGGHRAAFKALARHGVPSDPAEGAWGEIIRARIRIAQGHYSRLRAIEDFTLSNRARAFVHKSLASW